MQIRNGSICICHSQCRFPQSHNQHHLLLLIPAFSTPLVPFTHNNEIRFPRSFGCRHLSHFTDYCCIFLRTTHSHYSLLRHGTFRLNSIDLIANRSEEMVPAVISNWFDAHSVSVFVPLSKRRHVTYHKESGSLRFNYYAEVEEWLESHLQITLSCVLNVNPFSPEQELNKDTWTLFGWVHPMSPTQGPIQLTSDEQRRDEDADELTWKQMKFIIFDLIYKSTDGDLFLSPHFTSLPDSICVPRVFICLHAPQEWIRINTADHKVVSLWPAWGASIPIQFRSSSAT